MKSLSRRPLAAAGRNRRLAAFRPFLALLLAGAALAAVGTMRPIRHSGLSQDTYWVEKIGWQGCADMVIGGDSRISSGVSPSTMADHLRGLQIRNFGFYGAAYSRNFLNALGKVLDPSSKERIILLGITPLSLTTKALSKNTFETWHQTPAHKRAMADWSGDILDRFAPFTLREIVGFARPGIEVAARFHFCPDGYQATTAVVEDPSASLADYRDIFIGNPVSAEVIGNVIDSVRAWRSEGIRVYGFRPPTTPQMVEIENGIGRFDEGSFVSAFGSAGGTWIPIEDEGYRTYDGSHLGKEASILLSERLALKISMLMAADRQRPAEGDLMGIPVPSAHQIGIRRAAFPSGPAGRGS